MLREPPVKCRWHAAVRRGSQREDVGRGASEATVPGARGPPARRVWGRGSRRGARKARSSPPSTLSVPKVVGWLRWVLEVLGCTWWRSRGASSWESGTPTPAPRTSLGLDSVLPPHAGPGSRRMKNKASTLVLFWEHAPVWPTVAVLTLNQKTLRLGSCPANVLAAGQGSNPSLCCEAGDLAKPWTPSRKALNAHNKTRGHTKETGYSETQSPKYWKQVGV